MLATKSGHVLLALPLRLPPLLSLPPLFYVPPPPPWLERQPLLLPSLTGMPFAQLLQPWPFPQPRNVLSPASPVPPLLLCRPRPSPSETYVVPAAELQLPALQLLETPALSLPPPP